MIKSTSCERATRPTLRVFTLSPSQHKAAGTLTRRRRRPNANSVIIDGPASEDALLGGRTRTRSQIQSLDYYHWTTSQQESELRNSLIKSTGRQQRCNPNGLVFLSALAERFTKSQKSHEPATLPVSLFWIVFLGSAVSSKWDRGPQTTNQVRLTLELFSRNIYCRCEMRDLRKKSCVVPSIKAQCARFRQPRPRAFFTFVM